MVQKKLHSIGSGYALAGHHNRAIAKAELATRSQTEAKSMWLMPMSAM